MSTKTSTRRKREAAAGKVRTKQEDRKGIPDTPAIGLRYPKGSFALGMVRTRGELKYAGGTLHYKPQPKEIA